jgi:hypothetical protein
MKMFLKLFRLEYKYVVNIVEEEAVINIEYFKERTVNFAEPVVNSIVIKPFDITSILEN